MSHYEKMLALFEEMGLKCRPVHGDNYNFIDVYDNEGNKAEFSFTKEGATAKTGYYAEDENE